MNIGKFAILGQLGTGAHSSILHIRRVADGQPYALKVVPIGSRAEHKFLAQAQHEFRVGQMLAHPSLVKIHAFETQRDWLFRIRKAHLLIEYVDGKSFDVLPVLPPLRLLPLLTQAAAGLLRMHLRGVLHADFKPNNLLLERGGKVKILDYGLAWIKGETKDRLQGTPEYMAPETFRKKVVNEQTDLFNFGATMYRIVTGHTPPSTLPGVGSKAEQSAMWEQLLVPVRTLVPTAPPALHDLIHACLRYHPKKRVQSMAEVHEQLADMTECLT